MVWLDRHMVTYLLCLSSHTVYLVTVHTSVISYMSNGSTNFTSFFTIFGKFTNCCTVSELRLERQP